MRRARALALGLLLAAVVPGCEATTNAYCDVFSESEMCCARLPDHRWDAASRRCEPVPLLLGS